MIPTLIFATLALLCFLAHLRRQHRRRLVMKEIDQVFAREDANFKRKCDELMQHVRDGTF